MWKGIRAPTLSPSAGLRIPIDLIDAPTDAAIRELTVEQRRLWRTLRSEFFRAEAMHPEFDPRHVLRLHGQALVDWRRRRRLWLLTTVFRGDPRVTA